MVDDMNYKAISVLMRAQMPKIITKEEAEEQERQERLEQQRQTQRPSYVESRSDNPYDGANAQTQSQVTQPIHAEKKIGRNDPCPCGSGKKYKNCCGRDL